MIISELRDVPNFVETIADRAWHAWWSDTDVQLSEYRAMIEPLVKSDGIPTAMVAHIGEHYAGSVLLIDNDLDARPQYAPWIAALWVNPDFRRKGYAAKLIYAAREKAANLGYDKCYLCATAENSPYYITRGFRLLETNVDDQNVFSIGPP